ncbi:prepilin-type N-terminal cleavage/methylation domain-containing protein [Massilia sp. CCM 8734]|uniref:type II secretion system protein n=1 Tax=Massilia sp. CCM 8734 TaxID=2609283 RepID=UPI00142008D0|nr:prepilin-type N-terminal cleavage/methylation domain-containing protein [Massilia sp. CCM 8734]NHZ99837.1 prepilin-type N-terminal cleavage/methylation domain-containing protein [Massilia sp. CCM 8734]
MNDALPGRRAGFTLVELLVVMAIVALLLTIAVPRYFGSLARSKEVALQENLKVMRISLDKFSGDKGHFPESLEELVSERYLRAVPLDPITESAQTWVLVESSEPDAGGIVDVKSGAPGESGDGQPYASY